MFDQHIFAPIMETYYGGRAEVRLRHRQRVEGVQVPEPGLDEGFVPGLLIWTN